MQKVVINEQNYVCIDMAKEYPFGGIKETPEENAECLVRKQLFYES